MPSNPTYIDLINKIRIKPQPGIVPVKSTGNYILQDGPWTEAAMSTVHLNSFSLYLVLMVTLLSLNVMLESSTY